MSRKNRRDYNGRQGNAQRPWEQEQADWQNRGSMQRNQYDNIGRDQYGPNSRQGMGYGSQGQNRDDDEGGRPNWPGDQRSRPQSGSRGYGYGYGSADQDQGEEYGNQRFGGSDSSRRYRSQGFGGDQGAGRYQGGQSGGYGQNYGDISNRGFQGRDHQQDQGWGEDDSESQGRDQGNRGDRGSWREYNEQAFGDQGAGNRGRGAGGRAAGSRQGGQHSGRGPKGYRRGDERIQEDINEELTHHPEIDASDIEVKVSNGEVTLTGTDDNREAKRMAEDVAEGVSGVSDVHNQIRVQKTVGAARDDEDNSNSRGKAGKSGSSASASSSTGSSSSESGKNRSGAGVGS